MARRRTAAPILGLGLTLALTACDPSAQGAHPAPALSAATAPVDSASQRIGVLLLSAQNNQRSCTASVVDSPGRDLLITAAHCVYTAGVGPVDGLSFAPGYRQGATPLGEWTVDQVTVDQHWQDSGDPEYDVAFLTVRPSEGRRIEDAVGGNRIGVNRGFDLPVTITGYPFDQEVPITCTTRTTAQSATQQRFDCGGFSDGTSGSPWLTDRGELVGVIGGYQAGGDTPDISYSVSFDDRVLALYHRAAG